MKIKLFVLLQILFVGGIMAQGISFTEGSWNEILQKAKTEDKIIFMDAYAVWCGPCKMMARNSFPDRAVGEFFNATFVNVKIDMEKGEGTELAREYGVRAYPTLLFINGDGELVHSGVGYRGPDELLALGKIAADPKSSMFGMAKTYASGDYEPDFLRRYAMAKAEAMETGYQKIGEQYLKTQSNWDTEKNREFIYSMIEEADGKMFDFLVENREAFAQQFGKTEVINRIQALILHKAFSKTNEIPPLEEIDALFAKAYPEVAPQLSANFRMNYYQQIGDMDNFAKAAVNYLDKYPSDDMMELNNISWAFFENVNDMKQLKKAVKWAEKSVKLDKQYFNLDTLAALYFKTGNKKKGMAAANEAIKLAKANGEDSSGTEALIEMYNKQNVLMSEQKKATRTDVNTLGEFGLIDHLTEQARVENPSTLKGVGDDAAVIDNGDHLTVVSTDMLVEGIHFDLMYTPLKHLGYKSVVVNLSDIYAMNATPKQITVSIALSNRFSVEALEELYAGIHAACDRYGVDLVGGDTTSSPKGLYISITAIGQAEKNKVVYRNTAHVGDLVCITGNLGAAYLGLQLLEREREVFLADPNMKPDLEDQDFLVGRLLKPEARKDMIELFAKNKLVPTSMIDISDGLASELYHICQQSGVGAFIEESGVPIHPDAQQMAIKFKLDPITCALSGGEDYELLFTIRPHDVEKVKYLPDIYIAGEIVKASEGIKLHTTGGNIHPITAQGWTHFQPGKEA